MPEEAAGVWIIFQELKLYDQPLTYQEIKAYQELTGERLTTIEIGWLRALDLAHRSSFHG